MPFRRQWSLFDGKRGVEDKHALHNGDQEKNLYDFILIERQRIVLVDNDTGHHRPKDGTKQRKEAKEACGETALMCWYVVGDDRTPRRIRQVVGELQQEEKQNEEQQQRS